MRQAVVLAAAELLVARPRVSTLRKARAAPSCLDLRHHPLEDRYQQSRVLDLFKRLPVRMALFRIFAHDEAHSRELITAADGVLAGG